MTSEFIQTALKRWKIAEEAENAFRPLALDDLKFSTGEQWPENLPNTGLLANNARLTIDQTGPYIRQVTNDQRQNRPSLKITATDDQTEDEADILEGMVRHIQAQSDADIAYDTACDSQVRNGFGYFRILTDYCDEESFDQDIKIKRIKNPFTVYFDPSSMEPDYSDAKWCFIVSDVLKEDFKAEYPESVFSNMTFESTGDMPPGWMNDDYIRIAEYFVVEETPVKIYLVTDGLETKTVSDVDPENLPAGWYKLKERMSTKRKVRWYKINAYEKLEENDWAGKYIPVVPVLGEDLDVDGKRSLRGLVRPMKDPQRMYNYMSSAGVQAIALAPKSPWVIAIGQIKGLEPYWETANTKNWSHLPYNHLDGVDKPARDTAEPAIAAISAAINQAANDLSRVTGIFKNNLGQAEADQSGKAILNLQREGDTATYHFQDNLARAIKHLGRILLDLIPKIYDTPRIMRILHEDGTAKMQKINQPDKDGKMIDLSKGKYDVAVNVGPSYTTKRQETADSILNLVQAFPPLMERAGDLLVKNLDFPGADQLADRIRPPDVQTDGDDQIPPQAQAKMQQMGKMIQALTNALHAAQDKIDMKQVEMNSKERIAAMGESTKFKIAQMNNQAGITEAIVNQAGEANMKFVDHQLGMIENHTDFLQDDHMARLNAALTPDPEPAAPAP